MSKPLPQIVIVAGSRSHICAPDLVAPRAKPDHAGADRAHPGTFRRDAFTPAAKEQVH